MSSLIRVVSNWNNLVSQLNHVKRGRPAKHQLIHAEFRNVDPTVTQYVAYAAERARPKLTFGHQDTSEESAT